MNTDSIIQLVKCQLNNSEIREVHTAKYRSEDKNFIKIQIIAQLQNPEPAGETKNQK